MTGYECSRELGWLISRLRAGNIPPEELIEPLTFIRLRVVELEAQAAYYEAIDVPDLDAKDDELELNV